jgi:uncharacterized protein (TIGR00369 family)
VSGEPATHRDIDGDLCGRPVSLAGGQAVVALELSDRMAVDASGLVHGGFVFGLADHAAMLAVNEPTVVLAAAETRFLAPAASGERLEATARVVDRNGRRSRVQVEVTRGEERVFSGSFLCVTPARHVLDR